MSMPGRYKRKERSSPVPQTQPPPEITSFTPNNSSSPSTQPYFLPPGFKFVPSDQDLTFCYLKPYLNGDKSLLPNPPIHDVNIYESNPEQLSVEFKKGNEKEWFFISERNKMGHRQDGKKHKRGTNGGYWHATVATQKVYKDGESDVGNKTALAYYVGKQPNGVKTDWLMHEYWFPQSSHDNDKDYALCKIYLSPQAINKKKPAVEEKKKKGRKLKNEESVEIADVEQQPRNVEYPHQMQAPLDSYQPQSRELTYQQQQFSQAAVDFYQPQLHDIAYQQSHHQCQFSQAPSNSQLEEENGVVTQQQQQQLNLPPPPQGQESRSGMVMTGWNNNNSSTQEDLSNMSNDDTFSDIDLSFNGEFFNIEELLNDVDLRENG